MKSRRKHISFYENDQAVLGLPMRLTVSIIIGTVALIAILGYIMNPCIFPYKMIVSVTPMVITLSGDASGNLSFLVNVTEINGYPLRDASVIIDGLGGAGSGFSNDNGTAFVELTVCLESGRREGYLDVSVSAPCHETVALHDMIKIVRSES
jgi:hypothetical protein